VPEFVSNNSEFEQLDTTKVVKLKNGWFQTVSIGIIPKKLGN